MKFKPFFVDLQEVDNAQMSGSTRAVLGVLVLKYLSQKLDPEGARVLLDAMYKQPLPYQLREFVEQCYYALFELKSESEVELLFSVFDEADYPDKKEEAMTFAKKLRKEGRKEGIQRGRSEGRVEGEHSILIRQLNRKFGHSGEEEAFVKSVRDEEKIEAALEIILDAETKEQVIDKLR